MWSSLIGSLDPINQSFSWSLDYLDPVNRYEGSQALESHTDTALSSVEKPGPSAWPGARSCGHWAHPSLPDPVLALPRGVLSLSTLLFLGSWCLPWEDF